MARADQNNLHRSGLKMRRQQRDEQPEVPGATGAAEDTSAKAAKIKALKRRGKTEKHISEDTPTP